MVAKHDTGLQHARGGWKGSFHAPPLISSIALLLFIPWTKNFLCPQIANYLHFLKKKKKHLKSTTAGAFKYQCLKHFLIMSSSSSVRGVHTRHEPMNVLPVWYGPDQPRPGRAVNRFLSASRHLAAAETVIWIPRPPPPLRPTDAALLFWGFFGGAFEDSEPSLMWWFTCLDELIPLTTSTPNVSGGSGRSRTAAASPALKITVMI